MNFFRVYIEITNICGLSCSFCPPKLQKPKNMELSLFEDILSKLKAKEIALHIMGDPLLNKNLKEYLDLASKYKIKVNLTSSGFYVDKHDHSTLLHPAISQINFSCNSFNKNKTKLSLDEYLSPILSFLDAKLESDSESFVNLRLWNLGRSMRENEFNERVFKRLEEHFDIEIDKGKTKGKGSIRVAKKIRIHFEEYFLWPSLDNPVFSNSPCLGLNSVLGILSDGRVVPCCFDSDAKVELGNVQDTPLQEILENSVDIAQGLKNGVPTQELCKRCSYRLRFKEE